LNRRILRALAGQIVGKGSRSRQITREGQRERRRIVDVATSTFD
jgi:hypothetical protein